ncbi:hypothetical protein [Agrobacterium pusense]|uniref:hypothetical protein n=1 Tax=Agrobacterium pusense TaxID=648995 RepID=UPI002FDE0069
MKYFIVLAAVAMSASSVSADTLDDTMKARELGQIVGSADLCNYPLDPDKVSSYVSDALAAMEPSSRSAYQTGLGAQKIRFQKMTDIERKVSCSTQAKLAAKYGILSK